MAKKQKITFENNKSWQKVGKKLAKKWHLTWQLKSYKMLCIEVGQEKNPDTTEYKKCTSYWYIF